MNAKSLKSYQEKFSGDDPSRVSRKSEATQVRRKIFLGTAATPLNLKAFPKRSARTMKAHVGSVGGPEITRV